MGVCGLGFRVWGLGFRVWRFRVWGLGFGLSISWTLVLAVVSICQYFGYFEFWDSSNGKSLLMTIMVMIYLVRAISGLRVYFPITRK